MTIPSLVFGFVLSTLLGAGFHLWRGGSLGRLILYLGLGWVGFWFGHYLGNVLNWTYWRMGPLNLGAAVLGCGLSLGIGYWLSLIENY